MSDELDELFERSKDDHAMIVGSDIRIAIAAARRAEAALSEAQQERDAAIGASARCKSAYDAAKNELSVVEDLLSEAQQNASDCWLSAENALRQVAQLQATICTLTQTLQQALKALKDVATEEIFWQFPSDYWTETDCPGDQMWDAIHAGDAALAALNEAKPHAD